MHKRLQTDIDMRKILYINYGNISLKRKKEAHDQVYSKSSYVLWYRDAFGMMY